MDKPLVTTFIVSKLQKAVQEVMENALRGNEASNYNLEFQTKSGEIQYLLVNATTCCAADSNIVSVVDVAQDVTESSKNNCAIAAMVNDLHQLVDTANAPILTAKITGYSKEEAFNNPLVSTFIVPKVRKLVQEVLDNDLQGNETSNYKL
eukprot:3879229-Ditylum_brightwellii.AAC.1